jgi:hypothetical protein
MMQPPPFVEEVLRNIEYIRCPSCLGARSDRRSPCPRCLGWGCVVDPPELDERIRLGLQALMTASILDVSRPRRRLVLPSLKRRRG